LREPRKPVLPAVDQAIRLPCLSVSETCVLLNVARMVATPEWTFFDFFALTTFVGAGSSLVRSSCAEGASTFEGSSSSSGLASSFALGLASALGGSFFFLGLGLAFFSGSFRSRFRLGFRRLGLGCLRLLRLVFFVRHDGQSVKLMNAGLGIGVTLRTHGFLFALACTGVGGGALATNRKAA
jgi:hypothetical protein